MYQIEAEVRLVDYKIPVIDRLKVLLDQWDYVYFYNSNGHGPGYIALANKTGAICRSESIQLLRSWLAEHSSEWVFGYFGYDLKNQLEDLESRNHDSIGMDESFFFVPEVLIRITDDWEVISGNAIFEDVNPVDFRKFDPVSIRWRESESQYLNKIREVLKHIRRGDIYEMNYCHEYYAENVRIDPLLLYSRVNEQTNAPFGVFLKQENKYAICASPERFIKRTGQTVISQPIKGTVARGDSPEADEQLKLQLERDPKERSENIMIVDLVRNDLSKVALPNSVEVKELCQVYTFDTVHQMISTVTAEVKEDQENLDVILSCFPMGSMTGAPKIRAMQLIEQYEETKRGLYSGAIGYFNPNGDFDFNVVIRTLLYNQEQGSLSGMVGGAITSKSDPKKEYDETRLKAKALISGIEACMR